MRKLFSLVSLVVVLLIGTFIYLKQIPRTSSGELKPRQQIDLTGVKKDLLNMAQAERLYAASNGTYGSIEQLKADGSLIGAEGERRGYQYEASFEGAGRFRIVARPLGDDKKDWPTLVIDESMEIREE